MTKTTLAPGAPWPTITDWQTWLFEQQIANTPIPLKKTAPVKKKPKS